MPKKSKKPLKLNLGCGAAKIEGYVNIDVEKKCKPDLVHDFTKKALPFKDETIDEIVLFHTIEHIRKPFHQILFAEFHRVLKPGGKLYISYPNFWECVKRWKDNTEGQRDFWHATMFGRQLYPSDYHVCAMDPQELEFKLKETGFIQVHTKPESKEPYNSITFAVRGEKANFQYEDVIANDIDRMVVNK